MEKRELTRHYSNGEVTIVWQAHICRHSGKCFRGLPEVFDPRKIPWIEQYNSTTDKIINQVKQCPSGALSIIYNNETNSSGSSSQS
jgi:uncharacterized Fe-S cluster protein YjdI